MTAKELAKKYYIELKSNPSQITVDKIAKDINNLTYTETGKTISSEDKKKIVDEIYNECIGRPILEHGDNSAILTLIAQISASVGKK